MNVALAAKGDTAAARAEQQAYLAAAKMVPAGTSVGPVDVQTIIAVATPMLQGEILYREGKQDAGLAKLREAVKAEDALRYFEPPAWFLPVRHALGAALMQSGQYAEAEQLSRGFEAAARKRMVTLRLGREPPRSRKNGRSRESFVKLPRKLERCRRTN